MRPEQVWFVVKLSGMVCKGYYSLASKYLKWLLLHRVRSYKASTCSYLKGLSHEIYRR
jgi:hypothetical protein